MRASPGQLFEAELWKREGHWPAQGNGPAQHRRGRRRDAARLHDGCRVLRARLQWTAISWNLQRPSLDGIVASLDLMAEAQDFDSLHLQEMSPPVVKGDNASGRVQEWRGHAILWAEQTSAALVLHRRWRSRIRGTFAARRACGAALDADDEGTLVVVAAHSLTTWEDDAEWFAFSAELDEQIGELAALGGRGRVQFLAGTSTSMGAATAWRLCDEVDPWAVVVWEDNRFLVGSNSAELQQRLSDIQLTFATRGFAFSDSSLEVLRTPHRGGR